MQAIAIILAVVGIALALLGIGIKAKLGNVELEWSDKPPRWVVLPVAVCMLAGGIWLAVQVGRNPSALAETAKKEADPPPAQVAQPVPPSNASVANSTLAAIDPTPKARSNPASRVRPQDAAPPPPGEAAQASGDSRSVSAKNGSVAVLGNVTGSNLSASAGNGEADER